MCESKPFYCDHAGCDKTFTNEDHLSVHQQKHGLRPLNFDFASSDVNSVVLPFSDQTPTPTKFFRVEEGRLFEEISASGSPANPFDDQFRKATSTAQPVVKSTEDAVESSEGTQSREHSIVAEELPHKLIDSVSKAEEHQRASDHASDRSQLANDSDREASERTRSENSSNQDASDRSESSTASDKPLFKKVCLRGQWGQLIPVESVETTTGDGRENGRRNFTMKIKLAQNAGNAEEREEEEEEEREQEEAQIKRKIILTRNREAQWRSRKRKKNQVENLEKDCEDLRSTNETLQMELEATRRELSFVKELLQEHVTAGCEVAKKQELEGRLTQDFPAPDLTSNRQFYKSNRPLNSASDLQFVVSNDPSSGSAADQNSDSATEQTSLSYLTTDHNFIPVTVQNLNPFAVQNQDLVTPNYPIPDHNFVPAIVQNMDSVADQNIASAEHQLPEHQLPVVVCNEDLVDSSHSYTILYLPDGEAFAL